MTEATTSVPIDPFRPSRDGAYVDEIVEVRAQGPIPPRRGLHMVRTEHFDVHSDGDLLHVRHRVPAEHVDDDLAGLLADELFGPGWLRGPELFERIFTGTVLTSRTAAPDSWELFYRNTMARIEQCVDGPGAGRHGTIADYAPVYARAESPPRSRARCSSSAAASGSCPCASRRPVVVRRRATCPRAPPASRPRWLHDSVSR
ncbi:hypothetical protein LP418_15290 [Nocardioides sp. B-3]|nr:hypothetical protein [Nocardioides sp. B-3]UUZ57774.1 hypothetical protein LP418_15290 [Nocardioides sp. B-3]